MKKGLVIIFTSLVLTSCFNDDIANLTPVVTAPPALAINNVVGLRLEQNIVKSEVAINAKLPADGTYRIRISDLAGKTVSAEKINAKLGDNILKIYVNSLPSSSYTVELLDNNGIVLGREIFAIN